MSDLHAIELRSWVERVSHDPVRYLERQATEIFLYAIGLAPSLNAKIALKGGTLMGVLHDSPRQTADVDFTSVTPPDSKIEKLIRDELGTALPRAAAAIGNPDIVCRVQSITKKPRRDNFIDAKYPALILTVGYARRDSPQIKQLEKGQSATVIRADISFNEPVISLDRVELVDGREVTLAVYSLTELISEKLRALLQQKIRERHRRQDVYDIWLLLKQNSLADGTKAIILSSLKEKCAARGITPDSDSLSEPDVAVRAKVEWDELKLEIGDVPQFEACFAVVEDFYRKLPWG